jgi:hypothetical protein
LTNYRYNIANPSANPTTLTIAKISDKIIDENWNHLRNPNVLIHPWAKYSHKKNIAPTTNTMLEFIFKLTEKLEKSQMITSDLQGNIVHMEGNQHQNI